MHSQLQNWLQKRTTIFSHRQILVITGDKTWAKSAAQEALESLNHDDILWVGVSPIACPTISVKDYKSKLGQEYSHLVYDCFSGFRANAAIALSGTIKSNGLMIILCPELSSWPAFNDPEITNRISHGIETTKLHSYFFQHLVNEFNRDEHLAILTKDSFKSSLVSVPKQSREKQFEQQVAAVTAIKKVALGHRNRPLIINADRGRGKSSALGIAAAELLDQNSKNVIVTAPHINTVSQVFSHAKRLLPKSTQEKNQLEYKGKHIRFVPVDVLLKEDLSADIIFIDEAAAIPINTLIEITKRFSRTVYSTTIHGYEGSGRGFELRFKKILSQLKPEYKQLKMTCPIRWYPSDPIELFWFRSLMYNSSINDLSISSTKVECNYISKQQLIDSPDTLATVFSLLINAHYQTSPDDLQRLLDSPEVKCFILKKAGVVLGTVQIIEEGGHAIAKLNDDISSCKRRVKGHLVAQNIASNYHSANFAKAKQWRITRIAISPEAQNKGLGTELIQHIKHCANQANIDYVTTAFGVTHSLLKFWLKTGFEPVKISSKIEISSGEHNCICLLPLNNNAVSLTLDIKETFLQDLLYQMDKRLLNLDPIVLIHLLAQAQRDGNIVNTKKNEPKHLAIIKQFCFESRPLSSCDRLARELMLNNIQTLLDLPIQSQIYLAKVLLQNASYSALSSLFSLTGRKQIEDKLKDELSLLIKNF
ncbi:tRNA(Met) cytidine acetyltransferase TmcA [Paraglaciecola sp.]|uniref:tRNA(Met) cytidine acetyltransferase TmcA n=1 Tax=Paraglaciecola sp. TaxID=1920173 RepID=UPI003EF27BD7